MTNYFQGKWAVLDTQNNNYLSGDSGGIAALSSEITPSATFILYANSPTPGFLGVFMGYVQLQGNMQYIGVGNCSGGFDTPGMCQLVANAADPSSALLLYWGSVTPLLNFINATDSNGYQVGNAQGIGIVNWEGSAFFGFYTSSYVSWAPSTVTVITPGLYQLSQSQSWPNSDFSFVDLTGQDFSGGYEFQSCDFQHTILDQVNLSGANVTGSNFLGASLNETNVTGATLSSANFSNCDLTSIIYDGATIVAATQAAPGSFNSAKLPFTLLNSDWQWLDLRNATISGLPSPLSSATNVLQATGAKLSALNQSDFTGAILESAVLANSLLDGLDLSSADLSSASLIQASLHGTNLSGATLVSANLSGAQLGALGRLFTLPLSVEPALNTGQVSALVPYFTQNGITLSSRVTFETLATNRVWVLNDVGNQIIYTIRLETQTGGAQSLNVYEPAVAASLVNAYMPNAVLSGANLYGVLANNIQFYGNAALVDGSAVLEEAQFNGSNLSNVNFTQAQLLGTNLSASYLFNAQFNGANLTPSGTGIAADLSDANLQGADFTDAQLYGANLANAAVAINVPTQANPNQGGVYLFSLPYAGYTNTLQDYIAELNAAATMFSLNPNGDAPTLQKYVTALETGNLATLRIPFLQQSPPINLSQDAQIQTIAGGSVWQITDGPGSYTLWTDTDENGDTELYAAPSLTITQPAFQQSGITLRWQASVAVDTPNQQWLLDNDSQNPENFSTGYMNFLLRVNGSVLDVYGAAIRIIRLAENNQQEYDTETCNVTVLGVTNMNGSTICPNSATLIANQTESGENWDERWLRASALPKPPTCVPTDVNWCPANSTDVRK